MRITLAGPIDTNVLRRLTGLALLGAPSGQGSSPVPDLAAGLLRMGHAVNIVTEDASVSEVLVVAEANVSVRYVPLRAPPRYRTRTRMKDLFEAEIKHIQAGIAATKPDIVHAHWTYEYAEAGVRSGLPHLVTMHDLGWDYFWIMRDPYRFVRLIMKYRTLFRVRNLTVVAPFMLKKLKQYGYFGPAVCVPNGIVLGEDKSSRHLDHSNLNFTTIGNDGNIKNVAASVEAFKLIRAHHPQAILHLFGPGLDDNYAIGEPSIVRHGNVDHGQLMNFLATSATVLIHPSRMEACPVIIAEAKAAGVPVVGGRSSGGVPFVCGDNGGSILVDIEDPHAIADAALKVVASDQGYEQLSMQARADVEQRFSSDLVTKQYIALYDTILAQRHPAHQ